jgi:hypothetical protein
VCGAERLSGPVFERLAEEEGFEPPRPFRV